jgi:hypothetical protein
VRDLREALNFKEAEDSLVDAFYPIGFSRKGHFAYYVEPADEAVGQYLWDLNVLDMANDRIVASRSWNQYEMENEPQGKLALLGDIDSVLRWRGKEILADLGRFGIEASGPLEISRFPLVREGDTLTAVIESSVDQQKDVTRHAVVLRSARRGRKIVGILESATLDGLGLMGLKVRGYLASPYTPHIVVVVIFVRPGWEGPPHVSSFSLYGAHLEKRFER